MGQSLWSLAAVALLFEAALTAPMPAAARDPTIVAKEAASEVAFELAECAAYYAIAGAAAEASLAHGPERDAIVAGTRKSGDVAFNASVQLTSQKVAAARLDLSIQTMTRQMEGSWENFSIIGAKYMWPCKDRVEAPDKRFAYWLKEKEKLPDVPH